jgi:hypothetical protein
MPSGTATSGAIDLRDAAQGSWVTPATFEPTTVKFQGAEGPTGTYTDIYDKTGAAITMATAAASRAYSFPPDVFSFSYVKIVGTVGGNVAADRTLTVFTNN